MTAIRERHPSSRGKRRLRRTHAQPQHRHQRRQAVQRCNVGRTCTAHHLRLCFRRTLLPRPSCTLRTLTNPHAISTPKGTAPGSVYCLCAGVLLCGECTGGKQPPCREYLTLDRDRRSVFHRVVDRQKSRNIVKRYVHNNNFRLTPVRQWVGCCHWQQPGTRPIDHADRPGSIFLFTWFALCECLCWSVLYTSHYGRRCTEFTATTITVLALRHEHGRGVPISKSSYHFEQTGLRGICSHEYRITIFSTPIHNIHSTNLHSPKLNTRLFQAHNGPAPGGRSQSVWVDIHASPSTRILHRAQLRGFTVHRCGKFGSK